MAHRPAFLFLGLLTLAWTAAATVDTARPSRAVSIANVGFESPISDGDIPGWLSVPAFAATLDSVERHTGMRSLRVTNSEHAYVATIASVVLPAGVLRVRRTAWVRTLAAAREDAALWRRLAGPRGGLAFDNMQGREVRGSINWTELAITMDVPTGTSDVFLGSGLKGRGTVWLADGALEVAAPSIPAVADSPLARYVIDALDEIRANSIYAKDADWTAIRQRALAQIGPSSDPSVAHATILTALRSIGDRHASVQVPSTAPAGPRTYRSPAGDLSKSPDPSIGLIVVSTSTPSSKGEVDAYVDRLRNTIAEQALTTRCGWIVDLRQNLGGNMWPMLAGVQAILPLGTVGTFVAAWGHSAWRNELDGIYQGPNAVYANSSGPRSGSLVRPTAVLLSAKTASSGEAVAVALKSIPASRSFGTATAGLATAVAPLPLSDGASVRLSVARYGDAKGRVVPETLSPDEEVAEGDNSDAALAAATRWLVGQCPK